MNETYSPIYSGPAQTGIGSQAAKNDWKAIALSAVVIGIMLPALLLAGLYIGERHLAETAIYTA